MLANERYQARRRVRVRVRVRATSWTPWRLPFRQIFVSPLDNAVANVEPRGSTGLDVVCVCVCVVRACVWAAVPEARAQRVRLVEIGLGRWECAGAREGRCAPSAVRRAVGGDSLLGAASRARTGDRNIQVGASAVFTWGGFFFSIGKKPRFDRA